MIAGRTTLTGMGLLTLLLPLAAQKPVEVPTESGDRAAQEYTQTLHPSPEPQEVKEIQWFKVFEERRKPDALRRLIHDLDTGSLSDPAVNSAWLSLRNLGSLMVPALLAEMDDMGPFGLMNATSLLMEYAKEGLAPLVERYLKDPSPARQETAASLLPKLKSAARRRLYPLALASKRDKARLAGLEAMQGLGAQDETVIKEAIRIYRGGQDSTRQEIVELMGPLSRRSPEARALLEEAMEDPNDELSSTAVVVFVDQLSGVGEKQALQLMARHWEKGRDQFLRRVVQWKKDWPRSLWMAIEHGYKSEDVLRLMESKGIRLTRDQIDWLLRSKDRRLVRAALIALAKRPKGMVSTLDVLVDLMEHPSSEISSRATRLLMIDGPMLLLERGKLASLSSTNHSARFQMDVLERASSGHWSAEMFSLWKRIEQSDGNNYGASYTNKSRLIQLMAQTLLPQDWPLLEDFIRTASNEPERLQSTSSGRNAMVDLLLSKGYLSRELQTKALLLTPVTTERIAGTILNQISKALEPGEARPGLETAAFQIINESIAQKRADRQRGIAPSASQDRLVVSIFALLSKLSGSERDSELMSLVKGADRLLAEGAVGALLSRSKDRIAIFRAVVDSPHASDLLLRHLAEPELAKNASLREAVFKKLQAGMIVQAGTSALEEFLRNLDAEHRTTILTNLLSKRPNGVRWQITNTLLRALGDFKDAQYLPIFASYMDDYSSDVRLVATKCIGRTFSPKAAPLLIEALKDGSTAGDARLYLKRIDEYLQEKMKWKKRFSGLESMGSGPAKPGAKKK